MVCPMGHSFDVAKSGYVNLLLSQQTGQKHHGDDKRMVKARSTFLGKGYVDAVGAHEESVIQYMKDYDTSFRILEEPLMVVGIGVAFAKDDDRGICEQMEQTLEEMRQDGTSLKIIEKYLDNPEKYLEVDDLGY